MKLLIKFIFLFCIPGILLPSSPCNPLTSDSSNTEQDFELFIPRDDAGLIDPFAYFKAENILTHVNGYIDHVFAFAHLLTNETFLSQLSDEEGERVIDFITFALRFSVPKSRPDLGEKYEQDISELLDLMYNEREEERDERLSHHHFYAFVPALCNERPEFLLCKKRTWIKRKWHHFTHWIEKNKEPIIAIGIVAGVATIAACTGGIGAGSATAVGGGLVGVVANDDKAKPINKPGEIHLIDEMPPHRVNLPPHLDPIPPQEPYPLYHIPEQTATVLESIEEIKKDLTTNTPSQTSEVKRALSFIGHEILDTLSSCGLNYLVGEDTIEAGHEMIDRALGTNSAWHYTQELKEILAHLNITPTIAMAPPPTTVGGAVATIGTATGSAIAVQEAVTIYRAFNQLTGEVSYVGITNNFERRFGEHLRNSGIQIELIDNLPHLSRSDAKAVEQTLIELHKLGKNGGTLINKINSIAKSNPQYEDSIKRGGEILLEIGYE